MANNAVAIVKEDANGVVEDVAETAFFKDEKLLNFFGLVDDKGESLLVLFEDASD